MCYTPMRALGVKIPLVLRHRQYRGCPLRNHYNERTMRHTPNDAGTLTLAKTCDDGATTGKDKEACMKRCTWALGERRQANGSYDAPHSHVGPQYCR